MFIYMYTDMFSHRHFYAERMHVSAHTSMGMNTSWEFTVAVSVTSHYSTQAPVVLRLQVVLVRGRSASALVNPKVDIGAEVSVWSFSQFEEASPADLGILLFVPKACLCCTCSVLRLECGSVSMPSDARPRMIDEAIHAQLVSASAWDRGTCKFLASAAATAALLGLYSSLAGL